MTIKIFMTEPKKTDYVFVDEHGNLNLLLPIAGGETIATDNTCKMYIELRQFLGLSADDKKPKKSAHTLLLEYQNALNEDINLLAFLKPNSPLLNAKRKRLAQLKEYLILIKEIEKPWSDELVKPLKAPDYHQFNEKITDILSRKTNFLSMRLSPAKEDRQLVAAHPLFSVSRKPRDELGAEKSNNYSGLGPTLRRMFLEQKNIHIGLRDQIIKDVVDGFVVPKEWKEESLNELHQRIEAYFKKKFNINVNCRERSDIDLPTRKMIHVKITYEYLKNSLFFNFNDCTSSEVVDTIMSAAFADDFISKLKTSQFSPNKTIDIAAQAEIIKKDKLTKKIRAYWNEIYDYCLSKQLINNQAKPFHEFFDKDPFKAEVNQCVAQCSAQNKAMEDELFNLVSDKYNAQLSMSRPLSRREKIAIFESYRNKVGLLLSGSAEEALVNESDILSIKIQFFLGLINIYCHAYNLIPRNTNWGATFDNESYGIEIANTVFSSISKGASVEDALFALINSQRYQNALGLKRALSKEEQSFIITRFSIDYPTISASEHFDEFSVVLPKIAGDFFTLGGRIFCHMAEILSSAEQNKYPNIVQAAAQLKDNKRRALQISNCAQDFIEVADDGIVYLVKCNIVDLLKAGQFQDVVNLLFIKKRSPKEWDAFIQEHREALLLLLNTKKANRARYDYPDNTTLLMFAARTGHQELVDILLKLGVAIDAIDDQSNTALMTAVLNNVEAIVNQLLDKNADLTGGPRNGNPLTYAIVEPRCEKLIKPLVLKAITLPSVKQSMLLSSIHYSQVLHYVAVEKPEWFDELINQIPPKQLLEEIKYFKEFLEAPSAALNLKGLPLKKLKEQFNTLVAKVTTLSGDNLNACTAKLTTYLQEGEFELVRAILFTKNSQKKSLADLLPKNILKNIINTQQKHSNENTSNALGTTLLINAVQRNDLIDVNSLLTFGAEVNNFDCNMQTALHHAVKDNYSRIVETLLNCDAKPDLRDAQGHNALYLANSNSKGLIPYLITSAIKLTAAKQQDFLQGFSKKPYPRVLIYAVLAEDNIFNEADFNELVLYLQPAQKLEEIKQLANYLISDPGIRITNKATKFLLDTMSFELADDLQAIIENNILSVLLRAGQFDLVQQKLYEKNNQGRPLWDLLQKYNEKALQAIINTKDSNLDSLIIHAARKGSHSNVELCLKLGADVNTQNEDKATPLHYAANKDNPEIEVLLLENNADISLRNARGYSALDISKVQHGAVSRAWLERLIKMSPKEQSSNESKAGNFSVVIDILFTKNDQNKSLYDALIIENKAALLKILNTQKEADGTTFLIHAAKTENVDIISNLVKLDLEINAQDDHQSTALNWAVSKGNLPIVNLLLEKGAKLNLINKKSVVNAFDIATDRHPNSQLIMILLKKAITLPLDEQCALLINQDKGDYPRVLIYAAIKKPGLLTELALNIQPKQLQEEVKALVAYFATHPKAIIATDVAKFLLANINIPTSSINEVNALIRSQILIRLLKAGHFDLLTPETLSALCEKVLSSPHGRTADETEEQSLDRVSAIRSFLLCLIKNKYEAFSYFAYANASVDEIIYTSACCKYIHHLNRAIASNPNDSLAITKRRIVLDALLALLTQRKITDADKRIVNFAQVLTADKHSLCTRRDTALTTFIKALGVLGAFIFGLGIGGYFAYQSFFGENAMTKGRELLDLLPPSNNAPKV